MEKYWIYIPLEDEDKHFIYDLQKTLTTENYIPAYAYTKEQKPHITITAKVQLNDTAREKIRSLISETDFPLKATVTGVDYYPTRNNPAIIYAVVESPEIETLQQEIKQIIHGEGQKTQTGWPEPHITLFKQDNQTQHSNIDDIHTVPVDKTITIETITFKEL